LQGRLQKSEMESYQRTQALMLANDMANRITTNRADAANYTIGGVTDPASIGGGNLPYDEFHATAERHSRVV
jgi:type IV pilus assembly protein PilV